MVKYALIIFACLCRFGSMAQAPELAKQLTEKDRLFLAQKLVSTIPLGHNIGFTYENSDLYDPSKHDSACSKKDIDNLVQKLKGDNSDAKLYAGMGSFYKRLHKPYEADTCFRRSIEMQSAVISAHPDSAAAYALQALTYMSMSSLQSAKDMARRYLRLSPSDKTINPLVPMLHLFAGEADSARQVIMQQISEHGDAFYSYDYLPLCDFYGFILKVSKADEAGKQELLGESQQHSIIDFSVIEPYYRKDSTSVHKSLLYHVSKYLDTEVRIVFNNMADTSHVAGTDFKIILTAHDRTELTDAEAFFKNCLTNKAFKNKYYPNKVLGNIYFLRGDYKKAIAFTKKAIACKPLSKSKLQANASEDYHNLYSIYCVSKDTARATALALELLKIRPAIDSSAADYALAGRACLYRKEYEKAKSYYLTAVSFGDVGINTQLGLAVVSYLLKDDKQMAAYLGKAYSIDNTDWKLYAISGLISLGQGKMADAYFMLNKSLKVKKSNTWIDTDILKKYFVTK